MKHHNYNILIWIIIYSIIILIVSAFSTPFITRFIPDLSTEIEEKNLLDTFIFILTLIVAVIAFLFAIFGVIEFSRIREYTNKVDLFEAKFENHKKELTQHEQYLDQTIGYLFQATYNITSQIKDSKIKQIILDNLYHDLQIAKLYRSSIDSNKTKEINNNKFSAFAYLEVKGRIKDIPHLEYVKLNDNNVQNRKRANVIIKQILARIKHQNKNN